MKRLFWGFLTFCFFLAAGAAAEVEMKFYGQQWLRYEYVFSGADPVSNSFYVPRPSLRLKAKDFDAGFEGFLTLDINNDRNGQKVTSTASAGSVDWGIWVKYGYISLSKLPLLSDAGIVLQAGVIPVYFGVVGTWPYPLIEKAVEDRLGYIGSADQGIALSGKLPENWGSYELAVYNGSGVKKMEDNAEKGWLANIKVSPVQEIYATVSYYRTLTNALNCPAQRFDLTAAVIGGKAGDFEAFAEYVVNNSSDNRTEGKSGTGEAYSVFASYNLMKNLGFTARYDMRDPDTFVRKDEYNTFIAGANIGLAGETAVLQLNYQLDTPKFRGTGIKNSNLWMAQVKWNF